MAQQGQESVAPIHGDEAGGSIPANTDSLDIIEAGLTIQLVDDLLSGQVGEFRAKHHRVRLRGSSWLILVLVLFFGR